jgi:hypothetical protein
MILDPTIHMKRNCREGHRIIEGRKEMSYIILQSSSCNVACSVEGRQSICSHDKEQSSML